MRSDTDVTQEQAEEHRRAAEAAEQATLWQEAIDSYEQCLSLVTGTPDALGQDEAALLTALGRCYWNLSEARTAWRTLRRAISMYEERGDAAGQARATVEILRIWGPPDRHKMMADAALAALDAQGLVEPRLRALLLLRLRWHDEDVNEKFNQAMALGEKHGLADILAIRDEDRAWVAMNEGRVDDAIAIFLEAHETYARMGIHDFAAGTLRGCAFGAMEFGRLDQGYDMAERCVAYARTVHLRFSEQLALMDMAAVAFGRGEFALCEDVVSQSPGEFDFRADLYRMWMAQERGDFDAALRLMVNPDRGGRNPGVLAQIHAAAAGVLFAAGKRDAAQQAMQAWAEACGDAGDRDDFAFQSPPLRECLVAFADETLLQKVRDSFEKREERLKQPSLFSTLQGRALQPVRGAVAHRLGLLDEARRHFAEGLAFCERERLVMDAEVCRRGLVEVGG